MIAAVPESCELLRLDLPAALSYLGVVSAGLAAVLDRVDSLPERDMVTYNVQLAVQEACTNIMVHAYQKADSGRIEVVALREIGSREVIIDLYDTGAPFDVGSAPIPDLSEASTHGYGLFLMRSLMDEVRYEHHAGKNHWRLVKKL